VALVAAAAVFRVVYLVWLSPYTLLEDEAHYWEWSRRPEWSYYSKGPGVGWSIACSTRVFGDTEFGVRFPAVVFASIASVAAAGLARRVTGELRAGFLAAALMLLTPAFQLGGILMTIDMPYVAMWGVASWAAWRALMERSRVGWLALGAALGVGFLFKYTALMLSPGLLLFAVLARRRLWLAPRWGWWAGGCVVLLAAGMAPVVAWNERHGWPTVHHLLGHLGVSGGDVPISGGGASTAYTPRWTLEFLGAQFALIGPALVLMAISAARALKLRHRDPGAWAGRMFLLCGAGPILLFYLGLTFVTEGEGNWAVAAYMSLTPLAAWGAVEGMDRQHRAIAEWERLPRPRPWRGWVRRRPENSCQMAWHATLLVGVFVGLAPLKLDWLAESAVMRRVDAAAIARGWMQPGRSLVPVGRLMGARAMASDAASLGSRLRAETGLEPFYVAEHYGRASLLAFYLPGRPTVYCSSSMLDEGRRTQYDYWSATDLSDLKVLGGRPAVLIGSKLERWGVAFDRVVGVGRLEHETKDKRDTFLGYGYRGFGR
jgi:4-amino-4-deoxy-L-arabinose transferase-like glycosyltransferase